MHVLSLDFGSSHRYANKWQEPLSRGKVRESWVRDVSFTKTSKLIEALILFTYSSKPERIHAFIKIQNIQLS